jgi:hypothetical protein
MKWTRSPREADPKAPCQPAHVARATRRFEVRVWPSPDSTDRRADGADALLHGAVRDVASGVERTFHDQASMLVLLRQALDRRL